jgi:hypothetical protein
VMKLSVACCLLLLTSLAGAQTKNLPPWLAPYPGAHIQSSKAAETSYTVAATPDEVLAYYRKLLVNQALPFIPNFDGVGTALRASAAEGDLLLKIRESDSGTSVSVSCTPRLAGAKTNLYGAEVGIANPAPPPPPPPDEKATASDADQKKAASDAEAQKNAPEVKKKTPIIN